MLTLINAFEMVAILNNSDREFNLQTIGLKGCFTSAKDMVWALNGSTVDFAPATNLWTIYPNYEHPSYDEEEGSAHSFQLFKDKFKDTYPGTHYVRICHPKDEDSDLITKLIKGRYAFETLRYVYISF